MTLLDVVTPHDLELTDEQQAAVDSNASALVVTAPAGTGKTEALTRRTERFVRNPASGHTRALVVTYTTRAANEFTERLRSRVGKLMQRITADTVHGYSQTLLTTHGSHVGLPLDFLVLSNDADRVDLLASYDSSLCIDDCAQLFRDLDLARAKGESHPRLNTWRAALKDKGAVDFSEMIAKATEVLMIPAIGEMIRSIYGLVIVDEAQNLTHQQYDFLAALIGQNSPDGSPLVSTTLLGDPNQSVTRFAGGDSEFMERFVNEYCAEKIQLSQNFRSSSRLAMVERLVSQQLGAEHNRAKNGSQSMAEGVVDYQEFDDEQGEAAFIAEWVTQMLDSGLPPQALFAGEANELYDEDIAVLARNGSALNATADALMAKEHKIARAHKDSDLMSSDLGTATLELMRYRSERHRTSARTALARDFGIDLQPSVDDVVGSPGKFAVNTKRADEEQQFNILEPLMFAESPMIFVESLADCHLPENECSTSLANWAADRCLINQAWSEFANTTPVKERSWTRFVLHFERMARGRDLGTGVRLLTVHKAQAREFKAVAIVGMNDGQFPDFRATSPEEEQSELQTFYVAVTRASRVLLLTRAAKRPTRFGDRPTEPSPFLSVIDDLVRA